jgi:hypothetical protein
LRAMANAKPWYSIKSSFRMGQASLFPMFCLWPLPWCLKSGFGQVYAAAV